MWHIIKYRLYNSNKSESWIPPYCRFPPTFFLCRYLRHIKALSFTFTLANDSSSAMSCWTSSWVGSGSTILLQEFLPMFTNLGLHLLIKDTISSWSNCIKGSAVTIVGRPSLAISSIASTRSSILGALFIISG